MATLKLNIFHKYSDVKTTCGVPNGLTAYDTVCITYPKDQKQYKFVVCDVDWSEVDSFALIAREKSKDRFARLQKERDAEQKLEDEKFLSTYQEQLWDLVKKTAQLFPFDTDRHIQFSSTGVNLRANSHDEYTFSFNLESKKYEVEETRQNLNDFIFELEKEMAKVKLQLELDKAKEAAMNKARSVFTAEELKALGI